MSERDAADRRGAIRQVADDSMFGCMGGDVTCQQEFPTDPSEWCGDCILTAFIAQADADAATIAQLRAVQLAARALLHELDVVAQRQRDLLVHGQTLESAANNWDEATMGCSIDFGPLRDALQAVLRTVPHE